MLITLSGIIILVSEVQLKNALSLILVNLLLSAKTTLVNETNLLETKVESLSKSKQEKEKNIAEINQKLQNKNIEIIFFIFTPNHSNIT